MPTKSLRNKTLKIQRHLHTQKLFKDLQLKMTTHLASWGKMNFQRHKSKGPDSPRKSPGRSMSGIPNNLTEKLVNNNYNQHARQQTVGALLTVEQQQSFLSSSGDFV
jgi:hypothetical protein